MSNLGRGTEEEECHREEKPDLKMEMSRTIIEQRECVSGVFITWDSLERI